MGVRQGPRGDVHPVIILAAMALQFVGFLLATIDIIAISQRRYRWALVTNFSIPAVSYLLTKVIVASPSAWGAVAMGVGGALAAIVGIWLMERYG